MRRTIVLRIALAACVFAFATTATTGRDDKPVGYRHLNPLRAAAGMVPLTRNARLERAAQAHAEYLAANTVSGHRDKQGRFGFTVENQRFARSTLATADVATVRTQAMTRRACRRTSTV